MPTRIEIPAFPGDKRIAVTTSWDDGHVYDRWIIDAYNQLGIKGTFNLNSGYLSRTGIRQSDASGAHLDAGEVAALYAGHEVAIHSLTHPWLERLDASQVAAEVLDDRKALEDLVGYPVRGMAYPFSSYSAQVIAVLRGLGIVYARTIVEGVTTFPPQEPLAWGTTRHHDSPHLPPLAEHWQAYYANEWSRGVYFVWGHSYEFAADRSEIERRFTPLAGKPDVWYCTNIELYDYEAARLRLIVAANKQTVYNPSAMNVTILVDGKMLEAPAGRLIMLAE